MGCTGSCVRPVTELPAARVAWAVVRRRVRRATPSVALSYSCRHGGAPSGRTKRGSSGASQGASRRACGRVGEGLDAGSSPWRCSGSYAFSSRVMSSGSSANRPHRGSIGVRGLPVRSRGMVMRRGTCGPSLRLSGRRGRAFRSFILVSRGTRTVRRSRSIRQPLDAVREHGAIPLVDWGSWDLHNGGRSLSRRSRWARIIDGSFDWYIRRWATGARDWGHPFFLRFDHEMNGDWFPWSEGVNGNTAGQFVAAWRHVHKLFERLVRPM